MKKGSFEENRTYTLEDLRDNNYNFKNPSVKEIKSNTKGLKKHIEDSLTIEDYELNRG